ncbi:MAG TPA: 3-dehydroquinate synthase [Deltaproteobacteria bacterium]|nr:3-dehydroquinate synthase [Candidatus Binatota bacterium]HIL12108.1 3-dehydroquinate synthase [Deltaproteobacteria bacterium]
MNEPLQVTVQLGTRSYDIRVGEGLLFSCGSAVAGLENISRAILVTNPTVDALYGDTVRESLEAAPGIESPVGTVEIADGEEHKTLATVEGIYDRVLKLGGDRNAVVIALGGGVVGDVAGFAAATVLRGLRVVMLPTTLLAQVDSSVGGKTGVNRPQGKNLVGAFHQPSLVLADTACLSTLSGREYSAGLAEVVKHGVIADAELLELLEQKTDAVLARDPAVMSSIVARNCAIKADVVSRDETENGLRRILNFGHTVGHALERLTDYKRYVHGEAVSIGMVAAARVSLQQGACDAAFVERLESLLGSLGLPTSLPAGLDREAVAGAVVHDKKASGDGVVFILTEGAGSCRQQLLDPADIVAAMGDSVAGV